MGIHAKASLAAIALIAPTVTKAQDLTVSAGASIVSEYMSQGFELSDGPALQPSIELGYLGVYAGIWATNTDEDQAGASSEIDYYLGYGGEAGSFFYDVGYAYYTFNGRTFAEDYGEVSLSLGYGFSDAFFLTADYGYAEKFEQDDFSLTAEYFFDNGIAVAASYGDVSANFGDWTYWSVGAGYQVDDNVSFDLIYNDADDDGALLGVTDGLWVASVSFDFSLR